MEKKETFEQLKEKNLFLKILVDGTLHDKQQVIAALVHNGRTDLLEKIRKNWGEKHWAEVVGNC